MLSHREPGARLGVLGNRRDDLSGPKAAEQRQSSGNRMCPVEVQEQTAEVLVQLDGRVAGRVDAAGDARVDLAERHLVGDVDRGLEPGAAGLLDVVCRRIRRQGAAEHALARQVEVAASLEDPARGDLAEALALETEAAD